MSEILDKVPKWQTVLGVSDDRQYVFTQDPHRRTLRVFRVVLGGLVGIHSIPLGSLASYTRALTQATEAIETTPHANTD